MLTLIESPVANVANIARALRRAGADLRVTAEASEIATSKKIVLPGVGSFVAAIRWLQSSGIDVALTAALDGGASLLGVCVGHQLLFERSDEMGGAAGLGYLRGTVVLLDGPLPVPQIGWNRVHLLPNPNDTTSSFLFEGVATSTSFYFVNSFAARDPEAQIASAEYSGPFAAAAAGKVANGHVFGLQFHPEKSSDAGLRVLQNFVEVSY